MRYLFLLALVAMMVAALVGPVAAQGDEVSLVIWGEPWTAHCAQTPDDPAVCDNPIYVNTLNEMWTEMYPDVTLVWEERGWDETLRQNITTAVLGGVGPDITVGENFIPSFAAIGALAPADLPEDVHDNLVPGTVMGATVGDELYGVAAFTGVFGLEVNMDVIRAAGLDPDEIDLSTWESTIEVIEAVTEAGNGEFYGVTLLGSTGNPAATLFRAAPYLLQTGADFCNRDEGCDTPTLNDPRAVPVYEWFRTLHANSPPGLTFQGDEGYIYSQIYTNLTAMQTDGAWTIARAQANDCGDCRYFPLPYPEGGRRANVVVGNAIYSILQGTEHPEEASAFLELLVSDELQLTGFWALGRMPSTFSALQQILDVANGDTSSIPAFYYEVMGHTEEDAVAFATTYSGYVDELLNGEVFILPQWATNPSEMNRLWDDMFTEILTSDAPIQDILDDYQAQAEEIMGGS